MNTAFKATAVFCSTVLLATGCSKSADRDLDQPDGNKYLIHLVDDGHTEFQRVINPNNGPIISLAKDSAMSLIEEQDGDYVYAFKDMNNNGQLDTFEDWRQDSMVRAKDLASRLSLEQQSGLMLFSSHERAPGDGLTGAQKEYLSESHVRNVLNAGTSDAKQNVQWVNEMQAYVESLATDETPYVPVNYSSDPRSDASKTGLFTDAGTISKWPSSLGLAATFSPETVKQFAIYASEEYRALGIGTALSPQIDLATEPRWLRVSGTFGEDSDMAASMAQAYVEGFQGTFDESGSNLGWGVDSVNAMIKHFPGDGTGEGGRESHGNAGKYAVTPGNNRAEHLKVFDAALDATSVMTDYSIITDGNGDPEFGTLTGTSYDSARLDLLRKDRNYDGVVATDWGITSGGTADPDAKFGMAWGVSDMPINQRHFEVLKAGSDMFGGNNDVKPVLAAYEMWQQAYEAGELDMDASARWILSAQRVLNLSFVNGVFENPYLVLEHSQETVGSEDKVNAGRDAQLMSIVMLKNKNETIKKTSAKDLKKLTVYIPHTYDTGFDNPAFNQEASYTEGQSIDEKVAEKYFGTVLTDEVEMDSDGKVVKYTAPDLSDVDLILVGMNSPSNGSGFTGAGYDAESGEFYPLSLQYRPYTADGSNVRHTSIAGDILPDGTKENRSYYGHTSKISNEADLDAFERAVEAKEVSGKDIPIIAVIRASNPVVVSEFEADADAIVVGFGTADEALIQIATGIAEPRGRLPIQFPKDMDTVEANLEDVPKDVTPYTDSEGNTYDYGFGLNYSGTIS